MKDPSTPLRATGPTPPARDMLGLVVDRQVGPFVAAMLMSTSGVWIHNVVAAILVYDVSGSSLAVGMVSVAQFGPQLVLAPLSGAMADRGSRLVQLIIGRVFVALGSGTLGIWVWWAGVDGLPGAWPVVATAFVVGIGFVLIAPAQHALVPGLVPPHELAPAIALSAVPPTLGRAGGPAIGALVAVSAGPATAFMIAAGANLVSALTMSTLQTRGQAVRNRGANSQILAGLRHLATDRTLVRLLIGVTAIGVGADPVITLTPSLAGTLGEGPALVGTLVSAFGIGAALAFLVLSAARRHLGLPRIASLGLSLLAGGIAAAGFSPVASLAVVSLGTAGVGMTFSLTSLNTLLQERLPDALRGRVTALWSIAFIGSRPIAAAVNGAVSDATAPRVAFLGVALTVMLAAYACRASMLTPIPLGDSATADAAHSL